MHGAFDALQSKNTFVSFLAWWNPFCYYDMLELWYSSCLGYAIMLPTDNKHILAPPLLEWSSFCIASWCNYTCSLHFDKEFSFRLSKFLRHHLPKTMTLAMKDLMIDEHHHRHFQFKLLKKVTLHSIRTRKCIVIVVGVKMYPKKITSNIVRKEKSLSFTLCVINWIW